MKSSIFVGRIEKFKFASFKSFKSSVNTLVTKKSCSLSLEALFDIVEEENFFNTSLIPTQFS